MNSLATITELEEFIVSQTIRPNQNVVQRKNAQFFLFGNQLVRILDVEDFKLMLQEDVELGLNPLLYISREPNQQYDTESVQKIMQSI